MQKIDQGDDQAFHDPVLRRVGHKIVESGIGFDHAFSVSDTLLLLLQDLFHLFNFLRCGVFRRQLGDVGFDNFPDVEDVANVILLIKKGRRQRLNQSLFARSKNIGAVPLAALEELHGFQGADGFPNGGTGYPKGFAQIPFGGELIVPLQFPLFNERSDLLYNVLIRLFFLDRFQHGLASSLFLSSSIAVLKCAADTQSFSWFLPCCS